MRIRPVRLPVVSALFLLASCTGGSTRHDFRTSVEEGIQLAENTGGPLFDIPLFEYEVELSIEEEPDRPETLLYRPSTMMMDDEGCFYVLDRGDNRIVVYNQEGQFLRSFARKGDGPGEFQNMNVLRFKGDIMTIFDVSLQRTTRIRTDGSVLEIYRDPGSGHRVIWIERLSQGGYIRNISPDYSRQPDDPKIDYSADRFVVTDAENDTLCDITTPFTPWGYKYSHSSGSGARRMDFTGYPQLLYFPDHGILMSTGVEAELTWYDIRGRVIKRIMLGLEMEPVTAEERERIRQTAREIYERSKEQRPESAKASFDALRIPDYKAFWDIIEVDDAGYCWLHIPEVYEIGRGPEGPICRVVSPEGEYLGDSQLPTRSGTITRGRYLTMVSDEETGAITPTVFRIVPAVEGLVYP